MPKIDTYTLSQRISDANKNSRLKMGYSVEGFRSVLSSLDKAKIIEQEDAVILGIKRKRKDYKNIMTDFDNYGISTNSNVPLWKMQMNVFGSIPVQLNNFYYMVSFDSDNDGVDANLRNNNKKILPNVLSQDFIDNFPAQDFELGIFVDLKLLTENYLNEFYAHSSTGKFDENMVSSLISNKLLYAQLIFPNLNISKVCCVIGTTPLRNQSTCYITVPLVGAAGWQDVGIEIDIIENFNKKTQYPLLPQSENNKYVFNEAGNQYFTSSATMDGISKKRYYDPWLKRKQSVSENTLRLMVKNKPEDCYVKFYIPIDREDAANYFLPQGVSKRIYLDFDEEIETVDVRTETLMGNGQDVICSTLDKWSKVIVNNGQRSIVYKDGGGHECNFVRDQRAIRENDNVYDRVNNDYSTNVIMPKFKKNTRVNTNTYDCSGFVQMILFDTGLFKDDVQSIRTGNSSSFGSSEHIKYLNSILKQDYEFQVMNLDDDRDLRKGDILLITNNERGTERGHMAFYYPQGNKDKQVLRIGSVDNKTCLRNYDGKQLSEHYRHIIRIVDKVK